MGEEVFYIHVGQTCNNDCIFCYEGLKERGIRKEADSLDEIKSKIEDAAQRYASVALLGAEPTLRSDLSEIIEFAKSLGFIVTLTTNGRQFKNERYVRRIIETGINNINISLSGGTADVHDAETRVVGSFQESVLGLKNILKYVGKDFWVNVNVILNRGNYFEIDKIVDLLSDLDEIGEVNFNNALPLSERTFDNKEVIMKMSELGRHLVDVLREKDFFDNPKFRFNLTEFLPCSLSEDARKSVFSCGKDAFERVRIPLCKECLYREKCGGPLKTYVDIYGIDEFHF